MTVNEEAVQSSASILGKSWEKTTELERRVLRAVANRAHISRLVHSDMAQEFTFGERLADRVAGFGGSWTFILSFLAVLCVWIVLNSVALLFRPFDPYPFILLNLVLSCVAAIQAPIILMSQNRQGDKDRQQAAHDYEVNLKAELEIMQLHERLEQLRTGELGKLLELQDRQMEILESLRSLGKTKP